MPAANGETEAAGGDGAVGTDSSAEAGLVIVAVRLVCWKM